MMKRWILTTIAASAVLAWACSTGAKKEWRKPGIEPNSRAMRDQLAKDRADCATRAGAPTQGAQSTMSYSRAQVVDCMHARGWREVPLDE